MIFEPFEVIRRAMLVRYQIMCCHSYSVSADIPPLPRMTGVDAADKKGHLVKTLFSGLSRSTNSVQDLSAARCTISAHSGNSA
jgi:hypothetical protein